MTTLTIPYKNQTITITISPEDADLIHKHKWHYDPTTGYVKTRRGRHTISMHRLILGVNYRETHLVIDHINRNKLDNRRENLRWVTHSENSSNIQHFRIGKSGFKGITWDKENQKWLVRGQKNGKRTHLGRYPKHELRKAVTRYNDWAVLAFGACAYLNPLEGL